MYLFNGTVTLFEAATAREIYREQLDATLRHGSEVVVREQRTRELLNAVTTLTRPTYRICDVPGRQWNPFLALSEALWILAGRDDLAAILPYNQQAKEYSDDGETLYGAYGVRLKDQIAPAIERLKNEETDRRVVLAIWKAQDLSVASKDPPCNDMVMFKLRGGKLHMTVVNRSNDLHWGLHAVNLPTFGLLQEYIATRIGVEVGAQTHLSNSLHVYLDGPAQKITERMIRLIDEPLLPQEPSAATWANLVDSHEEFVEWCSKALDGTLERVQMPFLVFANDYLRYYRDFPNGKDLVDSVRFAHTYLDWALTGTRFLKARRAMKAAI